MWVWVVAGCGVQLYGFLLMTSIAAMCELKDVGCNSRQLYMLSEDFGSLVHTSMRARYTIKFLDE